MQEGRESVKKKLGLALGGGAGLGWAHIGVIQRLQEEGIAPDVISGCSIGSIVGACYAAQRMDDLEDIARSIKLKDMLSMAEFGWGKGAVLGGSKIEKILRDHFHHDLIEQMLIPFGAVAADLYDGKARNFTSGEVVHALRASSAVPGILEPVIDRDTGHFLVDGGTVEPVPVKLCRELGADVVIAVDLQGDYTARVENLGISEDKAKYIGKSVRIARASLSLTLHALGQAKMKMDGADIIITPKLGHVDAVDFTRADELIDIGWQSANVAMDGIVEQLEAAMAA